MIRALSIAAFLLIASLTFSGCQISAANTWAVFINEHMLGTTNESLSLRFRCLAGCFHTAMNVGRFNLVPTEAVNEFLAKHTHTVSGLPLFVPQRAQLGDLLAAIAGMGAGVAIGWWLVAVARRRWRRPHVRRRVQSVLAPTGTWQTTFWILFMALAGVMAGTLAWYITYDRDVTGFLVASRYLPDLWSGLGLGIAAGALVAWTSWPRTIKTPDAAQSQHRCQHCGYLPDSTITHCPECGAAMNERLTLWRRLIDSLARRVRLREFRIALYALVAMGVIIGVTLWYTVDQHKLKQEVWLGVERAKTIALWPGDRMQPVWVRWNAGCTALRLSDGWVSMAATHDQSTGTMTIRWVVLEAGKDPEHIGASGVRSELVLRGQEQTFDKRGGMLQVKGEGSIARLSVIAWAGTPVGMVHSASNIRGIWREDLDAR